MSKMGTARQVLEAADRLVAAFGEGRVEDYFACFHPEATFIFYTTDRRLESTMEWRLCWIDSRAKTTSEFLSASLVRGGCKLSVTAPYSRTTWRPT
jgi:hypothetical protein